MDGQLLDEATRRLYAAPPADFVALRRELAASGADAETAKAIARLRKPTTAARVVNALAADDPSVADRLRALGDEMRDAQDGLDAARMRELTERRRKLVADCTTRALDLAGAAAPTSALRDDVLGTFDAAVADPDVAARLGALQRPERFSGFGFATGDAGTPQLTLVRGGRDARVPAKKAGRTEQQKQPKRSAAQIRRRERELDEAQARFDTADAALDEATRAERDAKRAADRRERDLTKAKAALDDARSALDDSRAELKDAKARRREARSALDRAQRQAST